MSGVRGPGAMIAAVGTAIASTLAVVAPVALESATPVVAATSPIVVDDSCTLNDAIAAANSGATVGNCTNAGASTHILIDDQFVNPPFSSTDPLGTLVTTVSGDPIAGNAVALPWITTDITIEGVSGAGIYSGFTGPALTRPRLAYVSPGASLTLRNTSVAGFTIRGAASSARYCGNDDDGLLFCAAAGYWYVTPAGHAYGGAIYADGELTLEGVVMHDNSATGGASGFRIASNSTTPERAPRSGGHATGGAIYSNGLITIVDSVFRGNRVVGGDGRTGIGQNTSGSFFADPLNRDGGSGGDAVGADVALGSSSTAIIRRALFDGSQADGGDGAFGSTTNEAKNLERPPRASDGANGQCDNTPRFHEASGKNGGAGIDGTDGAVGGDGGDALGAVHTAGRLELDSVTIVGFDAFGGAAGSAGLPQLGGEGGDGGDGRTCSAGNRGSIYGGGTVVQGAAGNGGRAGWHGQTFPNGDRATAVAGFAGTSDSSMTVVNTSVLDSTARLAADNVDAFANRSDLLFELSLRAGDRGIAGEDGEGNFGTDGAIGPAADLDRVTSGRPGDLTAVSAGMATIDYSTFADNDLAAPSLSPDFSDGALQRRVFGNVRGFGPLNPIFLSGSVVAPHPGASANCLVNSGGDNVLDVSSTCFVPRGDDLDQPRLAAENSLGPALATDGFGTIWRLVTRAPARQGTASRNAINVAPAPCGPTIDARGAPRDSDAWGAPSTGSCDSGAHELLELTTSIDFVAPQSHVAQPIRTVDPNDRFEVEQIDLRYVAPAGSPDATVRVIADPLWGSIRCLGFSCSTSERFFGGSNTAKILTFTVSPTTTDVVQSFDISVEASGNESITMTAELGTPYDFVTDSIEIDFPFQPVFSLAETGAASVVGRCQGSMAFNFEIDLVGPSTLPAGFPLTVEPVGFLSSVKTGGGTLDAGTWTPDRLDRVGDSASIQVIESPGDYAVGEVVEPTISYFPPQSAPNITVIADPLPVGLGNARTIAPDPQFEVTFDGLAGIDINETRTVDVDITNTASNGCGDVTGVALQITDGDGTTDFVDASIPSLPGGATESFSFEYTSPGTQQAIRFPFEIDFDHSDLAGGPVADEFGFSIENSPAVPTVTPRPGPFGGPFGGGADVVFEVVFDKAVTGFDAGDIIIGGTTGADTAVVTGFADTYDVEVSGMVRSGDVQVGVRAGAAENGGVSSAPSNRASVGYDLDGPATIVNWEPNGPFVLATPITFNVDVIDEAGNPPPGSIQLDDLVITGTAQPSGFSISEIAPVFGPGSRTFQLSIANVANPGSVDVRVLPAATTDAYGNPSYVGDLEFQSPTVEYISAPGAPTDVDAVAGVGEAEVSWTPPTDDGGLTIDSYEIEVSTNPDAPSPTWSVALSDVPGDDTSATVTGLTNGTPVAFRVRAENTLAPSDPSDQSPTVTPNPAPVVTVAPATGQASPTSAGPIEFEVEFDVPVSGFDEFDVDVGGTVAADSIAVDPNPSGTVDQSFIVTADELSGQGELTISIPAGSAVRSTGQPNLASSPASVVFDTIAPIAVVDLAPLQTEVTDDPSIEFAVFFGEEVTGFTAGDVTVAGTAGGTVQSVTPVPDGYVVAITAGASRGTVQIVVADAAATDLVGFASTTAVVADTVELIATPSAPGAPSSTASDGMIELTWNPPADDGGRPVQLYEVQQSTSGGPWQPAVTESGTEYIETTGAVIEGLANDVDVRFRVAGINRVGRGSWSASSPLAAPTPPPTVVLARSPGQSATTETSPIRFTATFDQPVASIDPEGVFIFGPTGAVGGEITGSGTTYQLTVVDMVESGEVELVIGSDATTNANGQGNLDSNVARVDFEAGDGGPDVAAPWTSIVPARYLETRVGPNETTFDGEEEGIGRRDAGELTRFRIGGRGEVPADAIGAIVNITAIRPFTVGFVTAWSCEGDRPLASSLNYSPGVTVGNEVVVELGPDGDICLFNSTETDLAADVVGYLGPASPVELVTPARLVETRVGPPFITVDGEFQGGGLLDAGEQIEIQIAGRGGVAPDAVAVIANVTSVNPQNVGFFTMHPCLDELPLASSLNYRPATNRGNEIVLQLDDAGRTCLFTSAAANVALDVVGYLPAGVAFTPVGPARLVDTRSGPGIDTIDGQDLGGGPLPAGNVREVQVAGRAGVDVDATSVTMNVTAVQPLGVGYLTIWPCGEEMPLAASLNYVGGVNGGSEVIAGLGVGGAICVFNQTETHLTVDVTGFSTS